MPVKLKCDIVNEMVQANYGLQINMRRNAHAHCSYFLADITKLLGVGFHALTGVTPTRHRILQFLSHTAITYQHISVEKDVIRYYYDQNSSLSAADYHALCACQGVKNINIMATECF